MFKQEKLDRVEQEAMRQYAKNGEVNPIKLKVFVDDKGWGKRETKGLGRGISMEQIKHIASWVEEDDKVKGAI